MRSRSELVELHRRHVWPPYTSPERLESDDPLVIERAEGSWLYDVDGRAYLDGNASWWTSTLGHRHPRLVEAVVRQLGALDHVAAGGTTHPVLAELAAELVAVAPRGLERVHFSDDGSTAVEVAIKIAFQYWQQIGAAQRRRFVTLAGAYHGDTLGAVGLAGRRSDFFGVFAPLVFEALQPDDVDGLARIVDERGSEIAAIVVEPLLQGAGGMRMQPPSTLARIRELADAAGALLVADEVFTGYGRTGAMWACDLAGVSPDLVCVAKGFTAGMLPMAATLATARVYDGFRGGTGSERALMHGHSFCGHPVGAAVAREVLAIYREERIVEGVGVRAQRIAEGFERIAQLPNVRATRTLGIVGAADLGELGYHGTRGRRVYEAALRRGLYARPLGNTVYVCPSLVIPLPELDDLLGRLHDAIAETG